MLFNSDAFVKRRYDGKHTEMNIESLGDLKACCDGKRS